MSRVRDLLPGDEVHQAGMSAVFVALSDPHPLYPGLALVVWRLEDGSWSHDALLPRQEVGDVTPSTADQRARRLRAALLGPDAR